MARVGNETPFLGDETFGGFETLESVFKSAMDDFPCQQVKPLPPLPLERKLCCTLEELYNGATRRIKISRNVSDKNGRMTRIEETLSIEVKPGWQTGTRVTFPEKGSKKAGNRAADVVFVIEEKPHRVFKRQGDDLVTTVKVALVDALTGYAATINTLDGRVLTVPCAQVLRPGSDLVVQGEGMPVAQEAMNTITNNDEKKKGNLHLHFDIIFPCRLSTAQKAAIRHALTELR